MSEYLLGHSISSAGPASVIVNGVFMTPHSMQSETIYLLHFATPLGTSPRGMAQHYIGRTANLTRRIREHAVGVGARLPAAFARAGIGFEVTRVFYPGPNQRPSDVERSLKNQKRAKRLCPICSGANIRSTPYDRKEKEE